MIKKIIIALIVSFVFSVSVFADEYNKYENYVVGLNNTLNSTCSEGNNKKYYNGDSINKCFVDQCNKAKQTIGLITARIEINRKPDKTMVPTSDGTLDDLVSNANQSISNISISICNTNPNRSSYLTQYNLDIANIQGKYNKCKRTENKLINKLNKKCDKMCDTSKDSLEVAEADVSRYKLDYKVSTIDMNIGIALNDAGNISYSTCTQGTGGSAGGGTSNSGDNELEEDKSNVDKPSENKPEDSKGDNANGEGSDTNGEGSKGNKVKVPSINCVGLPGCVDTTVGKVTKASIENDLGMAFIAKITSLIMQFVAVFAVFSLMFSGVYYLLSGGEEEKINKAKSWIIWSLVGVFLSISAWSIIRILNGLAIG